MDEKRKAAGQKLLDAAQEFWDACYLEGQYGAVQWLTGSNGELVVYTRGEYRQQLMLNIDQLAGNRVLHFSGEAMPTEQETVTP